MNYKSRAENLAEILTGGDDESIRLIELVFNEIKQEAFEQAAEMANVCCCGDYMYSHASPINCGHTAVSQLDNFLSSTKEKP